jgi:lipopolysaccharide/colanic/teichoic acid biosynthesis glycosyltransferase
LQGTPGLTCTWQVSGRADIPFDQQVELDVEYLNSRSLLRDIKLIAKTVPAVVSGRGAY